MASEYGWALLDILEHVYFDDLYSLVIEINKRKNSEYKMLLAIAQSPHMKDPKLLWQILEQQTIKPRADKLDVVGFELFKQTVSKNPRVVVK